jgi:hypothetical protein
MPSDGGDDSSRPGPPPIISLYSARLVRRLFSVVCSEEKNNNGQPIPKPNCTLLLVLVLLSTESRCIQYCKATLLSLSTSEKPSSKAFFLSNLSPKKTSCNGSTRSLREKTQQKLRSVVSASRKDLDMWRKNITNPKPNQTKL